MNKKSFYFTPTLEVQNFNEIGVLSVSNFDVKTDDNEKSFEEFFGFGG